MISGIRGGKVLDDKTTTDVIAQLGGYAAVAVLVGGALYKALSYFGGKWLDNRFIGSQECRVLAPS